MEEHPQDIPITRADDEISPEALCHPGEDPRDARERIIAQLLELYPELGEDDALLASLRGEPGAYIILSVPVRYREAAPLIARIYRLLTLEQGKEPGRFRPPPCQD